MDTWREGCHAFARGTLQIQLSKPHRWVKGSGRRVMVAFDGRGVEAKGGTIKNLGVVGAPDPLILGSAADVLEDDAVVTP